MEIYSEQWEQGLQETAAAFPYPATPDIAGAVRAQLVAKRQAPAVIERASRPRLRLAWAIVAILLILGGLMAVPQVRAAVLEFLQIGAIRIFFDEPVPVDQPVPGQTTAVPTLTPGLAPAARYSILNLAGETTLDDAMQQAGFRVKLPAYPADLGEPDKVFYQYIGGPMVILVWLEPGSQDRVQMMLYALGADVFGTKIQPEVVRRTMVNGRLAYWVEGAHRLLFYDSQGRSSTVTVQMVEGNVLIWTEGDLTYRLETRLPMEEVIRIAESVR